MSAAQAACSSLTVAALVLGGCGGARTHTALGVRHRACPPSDRRFGPSPDAAARQTLVPGTPEAVLVCRYWGERDTGPLLRLAGQRSASGSRVARLAARLDALRPIPTGRALSCPVLGWRSVLLLFRYPNSPDDPVRIVLANCIYVSNGWLRDRNGLGIAFGEHWPDEGLV